MHYRVIFVLPSLNIKQLEGKGSRKIYFLMVVPLRPYAPALTLELNGRRNIFIFFEDPFSLMGGLYPHPPPCLNGTAIENITFLRLPEVKI